MSTNYKVAVWERDCEKMQDQFTSQLYNLTIKIKHVSDIALLLGAVMLVAYAAGLYFNGEDVKLLTLTYFACIFGLILSFCSTYMLIKYEQLVIEDKLSKEKNLYLFYESYTKGIVTRIKDIKDHTITYEIINKDNNCLFNWHFTADVIETSNKTDMITIFATEDIIKIEIPES